MMLGTTTPDSIVLAIDAAEGYRRAAALLLQEVPTTQTGISLQQLAGRLGPELSFGDVVKFTEALATLAFWSNRDPQQMERLLRRSARWDACLEMPAKTAPRLVDNAIAWAIAGCLSAYGDDMPSGSARATSSTPTLPSTARRLVWGVSRG